MPDITLRDLHWPSNRQHVFNHERCVNCGVGLSAKIHPRGYPCGSYPVDFYTPSGIITAGHPEERGHGFIVLDWPDTLTEDAAQDAVEAFIRERGPEMMEAFDNA
jgi:hypothetical protein